MSPGWFHSERRSCWAGPSKCTLVRPPWGPRQPRTCLGGAAASWSHCLGRPGTDLALRRSGNSTLRLSHGLGQSQPQHPQRGRRARSHTGPSEGWSPDRRRARPSRRLWQCRWRGRAPEQLGVGTGSGPAVRAAGGKGRCSRDTGPHRVQGQGVVGAGPQKPCSARGGGPQPLTCPIGPHGIPHAGCHRSRSEYRDPAPSGCPLGGRWETNASGPACAG
mmetsp:Transcript_36245/g.64860  ORF Transcript_36245/g.64860 Transcript_36245/m.64860 type:complete len:219 (+) Transcript_36245:1140-1796(+)